MNLLEVNPGLLFWTILTFVILLLLLKKFVWGPIIDAVDRREKSLKLLFDNAEKARKEAQEHYVKYEQQLAGARSEVVKIVEDGNAKARKTAEELLAKAKRDAEELLARAKVEIDHEREKATSEIRDYVVRLSLNAAEKVIERTLSEHDHRQFIEQTIADIEAKVQ